MIKAILFDMDGVLVNSEVLGLKAAQIAFAKYGARVKMSDVLPILGAGTKTYVAEIAKKYRIKKDLDELVAERSAVYKNLVKNKELKRRPGAFRLLKKARKMGLKTAIATASSFHKIKMNMTAARIPLNLFDAEVSGTRINRFKPYPDIFLSVARRLGVRPKECIVIEDAVLGIIAAKRAGMTAVGVLGTFPAKKLKDAGADVVIKDSKLVGGVIDYIRTNEF